MQYIFFLLFLAFNICVAALIFFSSATSISTCHTYAHIPITYPLATSTISSSERMFNFFPFLINELSARIL
jgi:hypothetical protein